MAYNLFTNSTFQDTDSDGTPNGWTKSGSGTLTQVDGGIIPSLYGYATKITQATDETGFYIEVTTEPYTDYVVSFYRDNIYSGTLCYTITEYNGSNTVQTLDSGTVGPGKNKKRTEETFTTSNGNKVRVYFYCRNGSGDVAMVAHPQFESGTSASPYTPYGAAEESEELALGYVDFDIIGNLEPATTATYDLGENSTPLRWRDAYFSRDVYVGDQLKLEVAIGTAPMVVTSTTVVANLNVDQVDGLDSTDLVLVDGSQALTADWDAGSFKITAEQIESDITTGTAPFIVTSTTVVSNLNADQVDGLDSTDLVLVDGSQALTANWDAGSFKITAETFESDVTTGTAPFTVASTTVVSNLNVDQVDGKDSTDLVLVDGSQALTSNWDAGSFKITAETFESDVTTGTAPFTVASTTVVSNLNVDQVDGKDSTDLVLVDGSQALTSNWDAGSFKITAETFESDIATGTAPFTVASTTVVTNLNADQVDGKDASDFTENADTDISSNGWVLDQDDMADDDNTKVPTQQSVKAYVDLTTGTDTSSATPTPTVGGRRNIYTLTALATDPTFAAPSGTAVNGDTLLVRIKDDGTGRTVAWNAIYRDVVADAPTSTTASKTGYVLFVYNSADTKWDCLAAGEEA